MTASHHEPSGAEPVLLGLRWAIKLSFVEYVMRQAGGQGTASAGATPTGNGEMVFEPADSPSALPDGVDRIWAFRGDVRFGGHFGMLFVRIADPWITERGDRAELTVVDPYNRPGEPRLRLVTFELQRGPSGSGLEVWAGTDVRLAPEGTETFNDVYPAGEPFEPLSITLAATARV